MDSLPEPHCNHHFQPKTSGSPPPSPNLPPARPPAHPPICVLRSIRDTRLVDVLQRIDRHPAAEVHLLTPRLWKEHFSQNPLGSDLWI